MSRYTGTDLEYYRKTWNGIKDIFEKLGLKPYQPFKYYNKLCYLDTRPVLIVYDYMFGDWIAPSYEHMQVDYILKNNENIEPLDFEENCDKLETCTIKSYRDWEIALKALELEAKVKKLDMDYNEGLKYIVMNEVKFRAWLKDENKMVEVKSLHLSTRKIMYGNTTKSFDDVILMQSTGLKDENDIEIYEGDILYDLDGYIIGVVKYVEGVYRCGDYNLAIIYDKCHVAGNIYENKELMKNE